MNTFENWCASVLEEVATQPNKTLSGDVDTIINSLGTLVKELTEELNSPEFGELNEADKEISMVWQWMWWAPKARKAQQKVNKIKLNITDLESAAGDAPNTEQRAKINAKASQAKEQASELQKMITDKFAAKGSLVQKALHNEKIKGQIEAIQRATGMEDNPDKKASFKEKMAELQQKYKEDEAALKQLEPSDEEKDAEKEKKQKEAEAAKAKQDKLDAEAEAAKKEDADKATADKATADKATADKAAADKEAADKAAADKEAADKAAADKEAADKAAADKAATTDPEIKKLEDEITTKEGELADAEKSPDKNKEGIDILKGAIAGMKKKLETAKQKSTPTESLVTRANAAGLNELASEIASKFDWQVSEGTVLHQNYDAIIKKAEYSNTLNESRYQNLSIKDRFSRLL